MFTKFKTRFKLEKQIASELEQLSQTTNSDEFETIVVRITRLQKLKAEQAPRLPSPDTMLIVGGNLLGILWLSAVERETPMASKALNFVMRPK
jgi:hypothetical protein